MPLGTGLKIFCAMPTRVQLKAMLGICKGRNPQKVMAPAVVDPATFGLTPLYKTMLDQVLPILLQPLEICCTSPGRLQPHARGLQSLCYVKLGVMCCLHRCRLLFSAVSLCMQCAMHS